MKFINIFLILILFSCSNTTISNEEKIYYSYLKENYQAYSDYKKESYDWYAYRFFKKKVKQINRNKKIMPENIYKNIDFINMIYKTINYDELLDSRERIFLIFNNKRTLKEFPEEAANLQFFYDCWVLEEEKYINFGQQVRCKENFFKTLRLLESNLLLLSSQQKEIIEEVIDKPEEEKQYFKKIKKYIVEFDFDSSVITEEGEKIIWSFIKSEDFLTNKKNFYIQLTGHTDRVGDRLYNEKLSQRRVDTVKHYLIKNGIQERLIQSTIYGESNPRIITSNNYKEFINRRVVITIENID